MLGFENGWIGKVCGASHASYLPYISAVYDVRSRSSRRSVDRRRHSFFSVFSVCVQRLVGSPAGRRRRWRHLASSSSSPARPSRTGDGQARSIFQLSRVNRVTYFQIMFDFGVCFVFCWLFAIVTNKVITDLSLFSCQLFSPYKKLWENEWKSAYHTSENNVKLNGNK